MIRVTLEDNRYNKLTFYFNDVAETNEITSMALNEGYSVTIEACSLEPVNDPEIE